MWALNKFLNNQLSWGKSWLVLQKWETEGLLRGSFPLYHCAFPSADGTCSCGLPVWSPFLPCHPPSVTSHHPALPLSALPWGIILCTHQVLSSAFFSVVRSTPKSGYPLTFHSPGSVPHAQSPYWHICVSGKWSKKNLGFFLVSPKSQFPSTSKWSISPVIYDTLTCLGLLREKEKTGVIKESAMKQTLLLTISRRTKNSSWSYSQDSRYLLAPQRTGLLLPQKLNMTKRFWKKFKRYNELRRCKNKPLWSIP